MEVSPLPFFDGLLARIIHAFVGMASGCFVSSVGGGIGLGAVVKVEGPLSPGSFVMAV